MKFLALLVIAAAISACQSTPKSEPITQPAAPPATPAQPSSIEEAVASDYRSADNRPRDVYRHPTETLTFFGLRPDMTVVEISPGSGWYMQILAPLLYAHGQYVGATPPHSNEGRDQKVDQWLKAHPELVNKLQIVPFAPPAPIVADGTADMVLTFRNVHNWMKAGTAADAFAAFFKALKPGGVLGVTEHRLNAKAKRDPKANSGYVSEADVIRMATKAGFKLTGRSEINANPKDSKNYPEGVWTLPPTLRLKDKDREKYLAIGESDRMTLRFEKPARK